MPLPSDLASSVVAATAGVPNSPVKLAYGTAGFRNKAELLDAAFSECARQPRSSGSKHSVPALS